MKFVELVKKLGLRGNSQVSGRISMDLFRWLDAKGIEIPGFWRLMLDMLQPVDPLRGSSPLPDIDIAVPFVLKDLDTLHDCVDGAVKCSTNNVAMVRLLLPKRSYDRARHDVDDVTQAITRLLNAKGISVNVEFDEDVVPRTVRDYISSLELSARYQGWLSAQIVKLYAAMTASSTATLIVDSDTLISWQRVWVESHGRQVLMLGQESRPAFFTYASEYLGIESRPRLSFITHHQLMQRDLVRDIFPNGDPDVIRWIRNAQPSDADYSSGGLKVAEYELYGAFLDQLRPERRVYAAWGNATGVRATSGGSLLDPLWSGWALSTSFHHYRSRANTPEDLL